MDTPIRVLIIISDETLRLELGGVLARAGRFTVVGELSDHVLIPQSISALQPDVILWDVDPQAIVDPTVVITLVQSLPASRILALCRVDHEFLMLELLRLGVWGYKLKDENSLRDIADAVQTIYRGGAVVGAQVAGWMLDQVAAHPSASVPESGLPRNEAPSGSALPSGTDPNK